MCKTHKNRRCLFDENGLGDGHITQIEKGGIFTEICSKKLKTIE